jgi:DNA-binding HxlR family transcriptional regulator
VFADLIVPFWNWMFRHALQVGLRRTVDAIRIGKRFGDIRWLELRKPSALQIIGGKWKVRIVHLLFDGKKRFGEIRRQLPGIGRGMLSYELRQLHNDGIVERIQYQTIPPTVEYALTRKGMALKPLLAELGRWGTTFVAG